MVLRSLALLAVFGSASAYAAFDLQVLSRYKASALAFTKMELVEKGPGETAIIGGNLGQDVYVAQVDKFGTILRFAVWDTPLVQSDELKAMSVATDGSVTLFVSSFNPDTVSVVRLSPSLSVQWERSYPQLGVTYLWGDASPSGVCYAVFQVGSSSDLGIMVINSAGTLTGQGFLDAMVNQISGVDAFPAPATGIMVYGSTGTLAAASKIEANATLGWEQFIASPTPGAGNRILSGIARSNGDFWLAGTNNTELGAYGLLGSVNSGAGFFTTSTATELSDMIATGANTAIVRGDIGVNDVILDVFNLGQSGTTSGNTRTIGAPLRSLGYLGLSQRSWAGASTPAVYSFDNINQSLLDQSTISGPSKIANITDAIGIGVESIPGGTGRVTIHDTLGFSAASHAFNGGVSRNLFDQVVMPDGSIVVAMGGSQLNGQQMTITRYRPDGTLAWARLISVPAAQGIAAASLAVATDGSIWALCAANFGVSSSLAAVKFNGNGATSFVKTYSINGGPRGAFAGPNGEVFTIAGANRSSLVRLLSNGNVAFARDLGLSGGATVSGMSGAFLPNGKIALGFVTDDVVDSAGLYQVDPTNGDIEYSTSLGANVNGFFMALDASGNVVTALRSGTSLTLRRRSASNLATQLNAASYPNIDGFTAFTLTPSGKPICAVSTTSLSGYEIRNFASNFATYTTSAVDPSVNFAVDLASDSANQVYLLGIERPSLYVISTYAAKYLANGARSAVRRIAGNARQIETHPSAGVWISGEVGSRKQGTNPYVARYSP